MIDKMICKLPVDKAVILYKIFKIGFAFHAGKPKIFIGI
ncbi:MAG: hypothetical protein K0S30_1666 [Clostridia bacterium]|jgi:hypothetical protein|nr:hypothetical protein [Clostridia bacterium]